MRATFAMRGITCCSASASRAALPAPRNVSTIGFSAAASGAAPLDQRRRLPAGLLLPGAAVGLGQLDHVRVELTFHLQRAGLLAAAVMAADVVVGAGEELDEQGTPSRIKAIR